MRFSLASTLLAATAQAAPQFFIGTPVSTVPILSAVRFARVIPVVVGGPQDTFVPNVVAASPGDIIQFQFSSGNHTVTQSTAEAPCQPLQAALPGAVHSGHIPFVEGQQTVGVFNMFVTNTNTMFLYCATGPHCRNGQVMVVNPLTTDQVVAMNKVAAGTAASTDGTTVQGGVVGEIPLASAAFIIPTNTGGPPGGGAAPAAPAAPSAAPSALPSSIPGANGTTIPLIGTVGQV